MGEIKCIHGGLVPLSDREPNREIIAELEKLLKLANDGQLLAIGWCTYSANHAVASDWVHGGYGFQLAAAVMALSYDYANAFEKK